VPTECSTNIKGGVIVRKNTAPKPSGKQNGESESWNGTAIVLNKVTKKYNDVTAVDELSIQVKTGELFGLLGPNGSGKTTTINVLCGLLKPTSGSASVGGYDVSNHSSEIKELIGVVPQDTPIVPYFNGFENVELFGDLYAVPKRQLKENARELLDKMGLLEDAKRRVGQYSGGMKRRISLVMGLVHNPKIAFLDEPTVGMDPQSRRAVWDFITHLKKQNKTIILTTQYMEEAEQLCDRVAIIDHGKLIALGTPKQLKERYAARDLEDVFLQLTGRKMREGS
jgi:ABC-2 type transport system ATP-binding protein